MKLLLTLFLFSHATAFAIDTGDGSDGSCDVTGAATTQITSAKKTYQCTTLNINGNLNDFKGGQAGAGGSVLLIKVQGNVTISAGATLDLSGANGNNGIIGAGVSGGQAGAGGSAGGNAIAGAGSNGSGAGAGTGGAFAPRTNAPSSYGGGGGGGSYKTQSATVPVDGDDNGAPIAAGANGAVFGSEVNFETSFVGGSGGAAGGGGIDSAGPNTWTGSSGGGGGGAIHIVAGGNITVDGNIVSSGGNGGGTGIVTSSGGGGGGSGGAIWLQAAGEIRVTGAITAVGGTEGINDSGLFGYGGGGGDGRVRLDDGDGVIPALDLLNVTPAPYSTTFTPTPLTSGSGSVARQYSSAVSCARVSLPENQRYSMISNLLLGLMMVSISYFVFSKKRKV